MQIKNQLLANDIIDQYRVVRLITATENAHVYLVYSETLASQLALKLDTSTLNNNSQQMGAGNTTSDIGGSTTHQHFNQQATLMYAFNEEEHLVSVLHTGIFEDKLNRFTPLLTPNEHIDTQTNTLAPVERSPAKMAYFVMPYFEQSLADLLSLNAGALEIKQAVKCLRDVLTGLKHLHENLVVHCDIKPENIFIDNTFNFILGDFDNVQILPNSPVLARLKTHTIVDAPQSKTDSPTGSPTEKNTLISSATTNDTTSTSATSFVRISPSFASPEQKRGTQDISTKSDIYSLGILVAALILGKDAKENKDAYVAIDEVSGSILQKELKAKLDNRHVPTWLQTLLYQMTQVHAPDRIDSAQACLDIIESNLQETEDETTQVIASESLYSPNTQKLREEIKQTLLVHGRVDETHTELFLHLYLSSEGVSTEDKVALLQLQIDEIIQELITQDSLAQWFAWVNYLVDKQKREGKQLKKSDYQQLIKFGRNTRMDDPSAADKLVANMFSIESGISSIFGMRYVLPSMLIVLVYAYWGLDIPSWLSQDTQFNVTNQHKNQPTDYIYSNPLQYSEQSSQSIDANAADKQVQPIQTNSKQQVTQSKESISGQPKVINQVTLQEKADAVVDSPLYTSVVTSELNGKPMSWRHTLATNLSDRTTAGDKVTSLSFDTVRVNDKFAVMRHEVTQALYYLCVEEGSCKQNRRFSAGSNEARSSSELSADKYGDHPMVNVSWFSVSQRFVPWLNERTHQQFALPRLKQWQLYAQQTKNLTEINRIAHCQNCNNLISRVNARGTVTVTALPADAAGLFGVRGNAQEWLFDCAINNQIERCDQALVIGGSWLDNRDILRGDEPSVLLKRAATPTTGFRLIEQLND